MPTGLVPKWEPPDEIDSWPTLPARFLDGYTPPDMRSTNHASFVRLLDMTSAADDSDDDDFVTLNQLHGAIKRVGDAPMLQSQYVRAWIAAAVGDLLCGAVLFPPSEPERIQEEAIHRLFTPRRIKDGPEWGVEFAERELNLLYNLSRTPGGTLSWRGMRMGQGERWLLHWLWLSFPSDWLLMRSAIGLAARLLRCKPLLHVLVGALGAGDTELEFLALAVIRRWLLTLKAMSWLEEALSCEWRVVRPQDLACFAFNAMKPEWPHRTAALSHRSADVKPALQTTKAWTSSLFALDANYVPAWETNTGMIWGLFATTPLLVRIRSAGYSESEWCQRESEIIEYLEQRSDFLPGRRVIDTPLDDVASLDRMVNAWRPRPASATSRQMEFPPPCQLYTPGAERKWTLAMLRAAGALRILYVMNHDARAANLLCEMLCGGKDPTPMLAPTNNPDGWRPYIKLFGELQEACGLGAWPPALQIPPDLPPMDLEHSHTFMDAVPDLSRGSPDVDDVLVAIEWRAVLLNMLEDAHPHGMALIDLRALDRERWCSDPSLSLLRGIAALRSPPHPVWFLQKAEQRAEKWGLPDDHPIFTEYSEKQFAWMRITGDLESHWPAEYVQRCGLLVCHALVEKCRETREVR